MGISPMRAGDTGPAWSNPITDDTGTAVNLTGASGWSLTIHDTVAGADRAGGGTFNVPTPTNGTVIYTWVAADTAIPGRYQLVMHFSLGGLQQSTDPVPWVVTTAGGE